MKAWNDVPVEETELTTTMTVLIDILPTFKLENYIFLMMGKYGPFRPNQQTSVPFWLGLMLKEKGKCRLLPPLWLSVYEIDKLIERQKKYPELIELPHYNFFEICYLCLNKAADDVPLNSKVRWRLEDLENYRYAKLKLLFDPPHLSENTSIPRLGSVRIRNLTSYEINQRRGALSKIMEDYHRIIPFRKRNEYHY